MSGFAILVQPGSTTQEREATFQCLLKDTAHFKQLSEPACVVEGRFCTAAKLDAPSSLHRGITRDDPTGSWLLVAGTVVALEGSNDPKELLQKLLQDYLENGSNALEYYDGHFALAVYNGRDENLSIISDPMGHFSIFYGIRKSQTFISTSALAVAKRIDSAPDTLTLESFLRTGMVHEDKTLWSGVKRLLPAKVRRFNSYSIEESEYWAPMYDETIAKLSFNEALEYSIDMLTRNFTCLVKRENRVWADLTGGFDTRVTTMIMAKLGIPFIAYCMGPTDHPDVEISKMISKEMGWEYQHMSMPNGWDGKQIEWLELAIGKGDARLSVPSLSTVLWGQKERSLICSVNVTGLGADEWREAAYPSTYLFNWGKTYAFDRLLDAGIISSVPARIMKQDRTEEVRNTWKTYLAKQVSSYANFPNVIKGNVMFIRYRYPSHGGSYMSANAGVMRSLIPFCLREPVNFALSLDYKWRLTYQYRFVRNLMERENPLLANMATAKGGPAIPIRITNLNRFWPLWEKIINSVSEKVTSKLMRRSLAIWPKPHYGEYPLPSWRLAYLKYAKSENLLNPQKMYSGALYDPEGFEELVKQAEINPSISTEFLDRVITVEMALRATGAFVD